MASYKNSLPNKIITRVIDEMSYEINIKKLAEKMQTPVPSLWNKIADNRRWDAETWFKTLWGLGCAELKKDKSGEYIQLRIPLTKTEVKRLEKMNSNEFFIDIGPQSF